MPTVWQAAACSAMVTVLTYIALAGFAVAALARGHRSVNRVATLIAIAASIARAVLQISRSQGNVVLHIALIVVMLVVLSAHVAPRGRSQR